MIGEANIKASEASDTFLGNLIQERPRFMAGTLVVISAKK